MDTQNQEQATAGRRGARAPKAGNSEIPKGHCAVFDRNAVPVASNPEGGRFHEVEEGRGYTLFARKATVMPVKDAVIFLRDPSFVVVDSDGNRMEMIRPADSAGGIHLQPGQVVANLRELTQTALLARARGVDPQVAPNTPREKLIMLLLQDGGARAPVGEGEEIDGEDDLVATGDED